MKYKLSDVFKLEEIKPLCDGFSKANGTISTIVDINGTELCRAAFDSVCSEFHRKNENTAEHCNENERLLAEKLKNGESYCLKQCKNGLFEIAVPIIIRNEHLGNFYTGGFILEGKDVLDFEKQAEKYGFKKDVYLERIKKAPVFSEEKARNIAEFLVLLTQTFGTIGLKNLEILEYNSAIEEERKKSEIKNKELQYAISKAKVSDKLYTLIANNLNDIIWQIDLETRKMTYVSPSIYNQMGYTQEEYMSNPLSNYMTEDGYAKAFAEYENLLGNYFLNNSNSKSEVEYQLIHKNGSPIWFETSNSVIKDDEGKISVIGISRNINERKQILSELKNSQELSLENSQRLRAVFENSKDAIGVSKNGVNILFNKSYLDIFGYDNEQELMGDSIMKLIAPSERQKITEYVRKRFNNEDLPNVYETIGLKKNGEEFPFEISVGTYTKDDEVYTIAVIRDISERKKYEDTIKKAKEQAEESEAKYSNIVKIMPEGVVIHQAGKVVFANTATYKIMKISESEDIIGKDVIDFVHPNYRKLALERVAKSIKENKFAEQENEVFIDALGNEVNVLVSGMPFSYNGAPAMLTVFTDITNIKNQEKELISAKNVAEESERNYRILVETSPDVIALTDLQGKHIFRNPAYFKSLGYDEDGDINVSGVDRVHPDDLPFVRNAMSELMVKGTNSGEYRVRHRNGNWIYRHTISKLIYDENNQPKQILNIIRDISDRKKAEMDLISEKEKAQERDRLKTAFLQNMSHEIRTPLNAICGFTSLLSDPDMSEEKKQSFVSIIQNSSNQLLAIVTDILTISSLETNQLKVTNTLVCVNNIIVDLLAMFKQQAINQNISFYSRQPLTDNLSEITTDKTKVTQILSNLLSNAFKFTHSGSIEFGYLHEGDFLKFFVKDTGIGIPEVLHEKIFERFRQADKKIHIKYGGTGLGLSISKSLTELLGGEIWLESEEGKGSVFYFTLPYNNARKSEVIENQLLKKNSGVILVAEDEEFNFLYIEEVLKKLDYKIIHAKNGNEAVSLCKSYPEVSLILMDIKMPELDGYSAAKIIKENIPGLPVIAQSAYALVQDREQYGDVFDDYITKPINKALLIQKVTQYMPARKN